MSTIKHVPTPFSYSAAVVAGDTVYLGLHRGFGDSFTEQCTGAIEGIQKTLAELDLPLANLVKVQVWLKDVNDLPKTEQLFYNYFAPDKYPARMAATTEFINADCLVMIEGIAYTG
ncbi:RidA family protein [Chloroflexota bacterium]